MEKEKGKRLEVSPVLSYASHLLGVSDWKKGKHEMTLFLRLPEILEVFQKGYPNVSILGDQMVSSQKPDLERH